MNTSRRPEDPDTRQRAVDRRREGHTGVDLHDPSNFRPNAAGIDLGKGEHRVCCPPAGGAEPKVRTFGAPPSELERLADWLQEEGIETAAMERTHLDCIPLCELLEARGIEAWLASTGQLHDLPGRNADMQDCQWLQAQHSRGLLRGALRPGTTIVPLRVLNSGLCRQVESRARCVQGMQEALDCMNMQVHRVVSDLGGESWIRTVRSIVAGERDPRKLAALRRKQSPKSTEECAPYFTGIWRDEQLFILESWLEMYDETQARIARYERRLLEELKVLQPEEHGGRCSRDLAHNRQGGCG